MSDDAVRDALAEMLVDPSLLQLVAPTTAFGYGVDLVCFDDLTPGLTEADPQTTQSLAQDNYHRLITDPGTLPDDLDYGLGIESYLSRGTAFQDLQMMQGEIETELLKDDRNASVSAVGGITSYSPTTLRFEVAGVPQDPDLQPFKMIVNVDKTGTFLQAIE